MADKRKRYAWPPDLDGLLRHNVERGYTIKQLTASVNAYTGDTRTDQAIKDRMRKLGLKTVVAKRRAVDITPQMRDFCFINRSKTLSDLSQAFNTFFGVNYSQTRIYRILLDSNSELDRPFTRDVFIQEWLELQKRIAPEGQVSRRSWLWRWHRADPYRSASGIVFHGVKNMPTN